jgi:hypothetical protein
VLFIGYSLSDINIRYLHRYDHGRAADPTQALVEFLESVASCPGGAVGETRPAQHARR